MTTIISVAIVVIWRLTVVWMKCDRAAYRWRWWKVRSSWGLLLFDLLACAVFFVVARATGKVAGTVFAPAQDVLYQLIACGVAANGVRGLRMPGVLKRIRGPVDAPGVAATPAVKRETIDQYIERAIQQSCYVESQLWIMETVVPQIAGRPRTEEFLDEVGQYLRDHDGPKAGDDTKWLDRLVRSDEPEQRKIASACARMLARSGLGYLERMLARAPMPSDHDLPGRHPGAPTRPVVPRPETETPADRTEQG